VEAARNPWPALGTLLVRDGALTADQLEEALGIKLRTPDKRLGEIIVEQGFASQDAVARVLAEQHELEFVTLTPDIVEHEAAILLPENLARRYRAIPVRFLDDDSILVVVADPTNVVFSDDLRLALGMQVRVGVAAGDAIDYVIGKIHDGTVVEITTFTEVVEKEDNATVLDLEHDTPAVVFVNRAIAKALEIGASDIHFTPQQRRIHVRARVDGVMRELTSIASSQAPGITSRLKIMGGLDIAERRAPQDGRVSIRRGEQTVDVRIAVLPTTHGEKVTLRILNQQDAPSSLSALGMWPRTQAALEHAISQPFGSIVVCGPTGSGKTTTLYACLQVLNDPERSLVTIEDPVEYRAAGLDQIEVNVRAGLSFASGLRTILRSDPDILLVGEIRDEETAQIAFRAAMTGHLVLTTLHAQTAASAIQRLVDIGIDRGIITTAVNCIMGQRLARRLCPDCAEPYEPTDADLRVLRVPEAYGELMLYKAVGCRKCDETGYRGRVGLFEVMTMTDEIAALVGSSTREIEAAAVDQGMFTLRDDGIRLSIAGITTLDEVRRVAGDALT
jgi:type IV pilus assembly protein PilB